jgi:gliding motility-associated-like protein
MVNFSLQPPVPTGTPVFWDFGNGQTTSGNLAPSMVYNDPGRYTVTCVLNNITTITAPDLITVYKSPSPAFSYEDSLSVSPYYYIFRHLRPPEDTGILDLTWEFPGGMLQSSPVAEFDFTEPGRYQVRLTVFSQDGCSGSSIQQIAVVEAFEAPNVFTPNDDAINDYFEIRTNDIYTYVFSVFTRSGVLIYKSESPAIRWDGRSFSGEIVTPGVYYYTVEQKGGGDDARFNGIVYLLR